MAAADPWKRYLEAGIELTEVTRAHAEKLVKDLVKAGEVQRHEAQQRVEDLLERSRKTTEAVGEAIQKEVTRQMQALGLVQPGKLAASGAKKAAGAAKKTASKTTATAKKSATNAAPSATDRS